MLLQYLLHPQYIKHMVHLDILLEVQMREWHPMLKHWGTIFCSIGLFGVQPFLLLLLFMTITFFFSILLFSFEGLNNIRNATELLRDMVNALNPADRMAVKDEIITDLVNQCRSNQQKLKQFVSSTGYVYNSQNIQSYISLFLMYWIS